MAAAGANVAKNVDAAAEVMLADEIVAFQLEEQSYKHQQALDVLRRDKLSLSKDLKRALADQDALRNSLDLVTRVEDGHNKPPAWAAPKVNPRANKAIPTLLLSDLHLDEVVDPSEMDGLNAYNREIAEMRLMRTFEKAIVTTRDHMAGVKYDGFNLLLAGDNISGFIHEELAESNEATIPATVDYWLNPLAAGIGMLADQFGKVHIAGVVGNHGRLTRKPRMKRRAQDNIDWLIYKMLKRDFRNDSRITWQIPDSTDVMVNTYSTKLLLTHGDQASGGGGVAGMLAPLTMMHYRKAKRHMETDSRFDWMACGHWHSYWHGRGLIVNGSTKGLDEYALIGNFSYEEPKQAMWLTTPEHGITYSWPIFCQDRKKEGW